MSGHADTIRLHDQLRAVEAERDALLAENQRLREVLFAVRVAFDEFYEGDQHALLNSEKIVREALAGDTK